MYDHCDYGNHTIEPKHKGYVIYTDLRNGITNDTVTCRQCYAQHVLKYYPASHIADYIRNNPSEYPLSEILTGGEK